MATATAYTPLNMDTFSLWDGEIATATSTYIRVVSGPHMLELFGTGFQFSALSDGIDVIGGTLAEAQYSIGGVLQYDFAGLNHSIQTVIGFDDADDWQGLLAFLFNGNDTFTGSTGNDVANGYAGNDVFHGGSGNDVARGYSGNDTFVGGAGNDTADGGAGADTMVLSGMRANYTASGQGAGNLIVDLTGVDGADFATGIERFDLADVNLAFDLAAGQAAGDTVRIIGAAFDAPAVQQHPDWVGIGLGLRDGGWTMLQVCELVIGAMGNPSNTAFVNTVYTNVVGVPPTASEMDYYRGILDQGQMSQAQLLELAANTETNALNIDIAGLQASGVEFV